MCELYHRSLITLGDDEFFKPEEGKNPLNTEEILDLSLDLKVSEVHPIDIMRLSAKLSLDATEHHICVVLEYCHAGPILGDYSIYRRLRFENKRDQTYSASTR